MLMLTPLARLPMVSLRLMAMPLVTPTMLESSLELDTLAMEDTLDMVLLVTVDTLAMVVSMVDMGVPMVDTMASVRLTVILMLTLLVRLPMDSLRLMPMPLVTPTMLESSQEQIMDMGVYLDMVPLVTVDTLAMVVPMVVPMVDTHTMVKHVCFQKPELLNYCYCLY